MGVTLVIALMSSTASAMQSWEHIEHLTQSRSSVPSQRRGTPRSFPSSESRVNGQILPCHYDECPNGYMPIECSIHDAPGIVYSSQTKMFKDCAVWVQNRQGKSCSHLYEVRIEGFESYYAHFCNDECYTAEMTSR